MDTVTTNLRDAIKKVILEYADEQPISADVSTEVVMDEERGHYEVLALGWCGNKRVHHSIIHIDLIGDKVWLQHDGTDRIIADELVTPVFRLNPWCLASVIRVCVLSPILRLLDITYYSQHASEVYLLIADHSFTRA